MWNVKSKEYSDKFKKEEAYKVLVYQMKKLNPEARKDDVVKKIGMCETIHERTGEYVHLQRTRTLDMETIQGRVIA